MPVSLVLFDMDDVLCHYDRSARVRQLAILSNRSPNEVGHAIWGSGLEAKADAGSIDDAEYLRETGVLLGCDLSLDDWLQARRASMSPNFPVLELAEAISDKCRVAVLTNNPQIVAKHIAFLCPAIAELFGANVFSSALFKAAKPSLETFQKCLHVLDVPPAEALFVDDLEVNVAGARKAGLLGHVFVGHRLLADELRAYHLLGG